MDLTQQQSRIKSLIAKGKEQGYLTYHEVNDHLPEGIVDPDQIEDIISMINDMGIAVHETAPDDETLLMNETAASTDEDVAEETAAALATLESEFGRTTDPVRMYMREMGTVDLLTRQGEILIAKRIEEGLTQVLSALGTYPNTISEFLDLYGMVKGGEIKLTELISGFTDQNETDEVIPHPPAHQNGPAVGSSDDENEGEEESIYTGPDPELTKEHFSSLEAVFAKAVKTAGKSGWASKKCQKFRKELAEGFLLFKLAPKVVDRLIGRLRNVVERVRSIERNIMRLCVKFGGMPR
ncbi:MAG: RNA polymerase sigma factor RpoD, partial [Gammaproteobacteria bacterium]|nr:RNA polymerase sigma factor RpoD [Gammaproteobacteria bacterium]